MNSFMLRLLELRSRSFQLRDEPPITKPPGGGGGKDDPKDPPPGPSLVEFERIKAENETLKKAEASRKEKQLTEQNEFKTLWEQEKKAREDKDAELMKERTGRATEKKLSAVRDEAVKMGLHPSAANDLAMFNVDGLKLDEKGQVLGAKKFAETLKTTRPYLFSGVPPVINGGLPEIEGGGGGDTKVTADGLYKLEKTWLESGKEEDRTKYMEAADRFLGKKPKQ